jgi:oligopeptide transport system ATP-binding protein
MYAGRIVERARVDELFADPRHPYTRGLIRSVPRVDRGGATRLYSIEGQPPNVIDLPDCCPFYPRCEHAMEVCKRRYPPQERFTKGSRMVHCWLYTKEDVVVR